MKELEHLYTAEDSAKYPRNFTAFDLLMQELTATGMVEGEGSPGKPVIKE
jgi:hypothetical protein